MEDLLKQELNTSRLAQFGSRSGGCISSGQGYVTDHGKVYVKVNEKPEARRMFDGEFASLEAIYKTNTVRVPKPIKVLDLANGSTACVMEYLELKTLRKFQARLGEKMARLHLHNANLLGEKIKRESSVHHSDASEEEAVEKFGFHLPTCCGYLPQDNTWQTDWPTFYTRQKLQLQLDMVEKDYHDEEARSLWAELMPKVSSFFKNIHIVPALLHGDLWGGNAEEMADDSGPVVFDPASFYGHNEYELAIASMFGGFSSEFFRAYHHLCPKQPGFSSRSKLYQLFHYLNHWNHFGTGYRGQSIGIMKELIRCAP